MSKRSGPKGSPADQLDKAVQALFVRSRKTGVEPDVAPLVAIAHELLYLPREGFKTGLKLELERKYSMATQAQPAIRQTAAPRLRIKNVAAAIKFYEEVFGAKEITRFEVHGQIPHVELAIGNSVIMLGEEAPEYGFPGPEAYGGSPVSIHLFVEDVDKVAGHAVAAGARLIRPPSDQFYGDRDAILADPFGYNWHVATHKEELSEREMHRRFEAMEKEQEAKKPTPGEAPGETQTITPYLVAQDAAGLIDFVKDTFGARENFRGIGSAGGMHADISLGESKLMIGGGGPKLAWRGESQPMALHVYVEDIDTVYQRALNAGAISIHPPQDQEYGERSAGVKDSAGNYWYIATYKGERYVPQGLRTVTPYLHPLRAEPVINFLRRAFGATDVEKYASPDGVIHHAKVKIGNSVLEMGEAHGPYQPMPATFYLDVPNVDATHVRAVGAGATSVSEPADRPFGARTSTVKDAFGNEWYIATTIGKAQ